MDNTSSEVRQQINRGIYALLSLTVGGVVAFAAYVVSHMQGDIDRCKSMLVSIHQEVANINASQARRGEQIDELKRRITDMHEDMGKKW